MLMNESPSLLQWFPLEGVQSGEVRFKLQWFSLNADSSLLTEVTSLSLTFLPSESFHQHLYSTSPGSYSTF